MNQFETELERARRRQRRFYWLATIFLVVAATATGSAIAVTTGTAIQVIPEEAADNAVIRVKSGAAIAFGSALYALSGEPTISVSAAGYITSERPITQSERGGTVEVVLRELPGRLEVRTNPSAAGTSWSLDGELVDQASTLSVERPPADYRVEYNHPYFEAGALEVTLRRGEFTKREVSLTPVSGRLEIRSLPPGAEVKVNGQVQGGRPRVLSLPGGKYKIEVSREDYLPVTETLEVTNQRPSLQREYRLTKRPGYVLFNVAPKGGSLLLNGKAVKASTNLAVAADSENQVSYFAEGYLAKSFVVRVRPGKTETVNVKLEPEFGEVSVVTRPLARVFAGPNDLGETPLTTKLAAISQTIEIRRPGYRTISTKILPSSKSPIQINETLLTELQARLKEAPRQYANKAGISLILFQPGRFRMGAPRHEPGQRANEFLRSINLKKPFYAGKYEVTNEQFKKFRSAHTGPAKEPIVSVTWIDAAMYTNWLSSLEGLKHFYRFVDGELVGFSPKSDGYRLLTEAEWEWLARRSGRSSETIYPWGDKPTVPSRAGNLADESARGTTKFYVPRYTDGFARLAPVGSFKAEKSGLFDLTGNVSEWVNDFYSLVPPDNNRVETDPLGLKGGDSHTIKGASWRSASRSKLRASYRDGLSNKADDVGFRVGRYLWGGSIDGN